jgi:hypothetical protein
LQKLEVGKRSRNAQSKALGRQFAIKNALDKAKTVLEAKVA